ncbi:hypothetical protein AVEN_197527-1 [Araneus ventricosus]|uniref:Uncharacterized protein n=1 Tax=Araneus ventricosus TaxID=182803 RepID=A0A4Y2BT83_ARAVE|nr:hypothetical protein AVEN_197527-1 [Araneus ventricosus]
MRQPTVGFLLFACKPTFRGEMKGLPFISPTTRSEEKRENGADESIPKIGPRWPRVGYRLWCRRLPGPKPDSTEDPPCMGPAAR